MRFKFRSPVIFRFPIVIEPSYMSEVKKALGEGHKLLAIKLYKDGKNIGLREAKDYVFDVLVPRYYKEPVRFNDCDHDGMGSY
jgi:ribosomal protein L7/L12